MTDTVEQLKRIADALEAQNTLEREIFEFNKQLMEADIARQAAEQELVQSTSTKYQPLPSSYPLEAVIQDLRIQGHPNE